MIRRPLPSNLTAEQLVEKAKKHREGRRDSKYIDDKFLCSIDEMRTLLKAGAKPLGVNGLQTGGESYVHLVNYEGHNFVSTSFNFIEDFERSAGKLDNNKINRPYFKNREN